MRRTNIPAVVLATVLAAAPCAAADTSVTHLALRPADTGPTDDERPAAPATGASRRAPSWYLYGGRFEPEDEDRRLEHPGSSFTFGIGVAARPLEHLLVRFEIPLLYAEYDTPPSVVGDPWTVIDDRVGVSSSGLALDASLIHAGADLQIYAGAGLGFYSSTLTIRGTTFGLPGSAEEDDTDWGRHAHAGVSFRAGRRWWLGLEVRRLWLEADFGAVTPEAVEVGGTSGMLVFTFGM